MMNDELRARFKGKGASQSLAVAALLRCVLENRSPTFGEMAVVYREDHLELHREDRGDIGQVGGALSVDEVRRHLERSVLPRLATAGVLEPLPDTLDVETVIGLSSELRGIVHVDLQAARDVLMEIAQDAVHSAETTGHAPYAEDGWGSTLSARGITKIYKRRRVVDQVDVEVRQGEIVGLLGPNGAGKTTSFYMIVGLIRPDEGDIFIDGQSISGLPMYKRARRGIGYLAQEPSVFRKLTVEGNVMAILETLKLTDDERRERLESLLDELSIKHLRSVAAYNLSGGERRRLEITRALVTEPKFMLLDEPFAGVDPIAVHDIQTIVAGLRRRGIGVLITDHNVEQTLDIVDRAYIMFEGQVQVSGSVRDLVLDDRVADLYLGPTLTARLRDRLGVSV
jgi:lipopolysaccharide export system ATP-binding protein